MNARRNLLACLVVPVLLSLAPNVRSAQGDPFPVSIKVDAATSRGELKPIWRFFGADEPNYAYMKDGRKLLAAAGPSSGRRRSISAPTTCSTPATARPR